MARVSKGRLRQAISDQGGVITRVARTFGVTRQTVYAWIEKYELDDDLRDAREDMFDLAEDNIFRAVRAGDIDASKFALTHMPSPRKWSKATTVTHAGSIGIHEQYESAADEFNSLVADSAARINADAVSSEADD